MQVPKTPPPAFAENGWMGTGSSRLNARFSLPGVFLQTGVPRPTAAKQRRKAGPIIPVPERLRGVQ